MEWEFSLEDVVKARTDYGIVDFRRDLAQELRDNLGAMDEAQLVRSFNLVYDLCYAMATHKDVDEFLDGLAYDPPTCEFLSAVQPYMHANAEMLGAILQRLIVDRVEAQMPLEQAVQDAARWHASVVDGRLPDAVT